MAPRRSTSPEPPLTSVIVPVFDRLPYTKLCIDSLLGHTPQGTFELIVIDNGSAPETADYLATTPAKVVRFDENMGIAPAWNAGIREAHGSYLAFVDNDVLFSEGWLEGLLRGFTSEDTWAVVPKMTEVVVPRDFGRWAPDMLPQPIMTADAILLGTLFVVPKRVIDRLGTFDERFGAGPYADLDFQFRLFRKGKKTLTVRNVCVHHFEGRTVTHIPGFFDVMEEQNRGLIERKWNPAQPLEPMSADFEFELWQKRIMAQPEPDPEQIAERARFDRSALVSGPVRIIACVSVFNDLLVLPECLASIDGVDEICIVDGAYAEFEHDKPYSTDGTLEHVRRLAEKDARIRLIECEKAWRDEPAKRSAYFIGSDGDWYLHIDADERLVTDTGADGADGVLATIRAHLEACLLDVHSLPILDPDKNVMDMMLPRLFRHKDGMRYEAAHWNVVSGDSCVAAGWFGQLPIAGVAIHHARRERPAARRTAQDAYYRDMYAREAEAFEQRIAEIEGQLTGDAAADAARLELLWTYHSAALYQRQYHEEQQ